MFDHIKRISFWTTLGAHVYDPLHCKVMTIYCCDMTSKMVEHQKQMWLSLIYVMKKQINPKFRPCRVEWEVAKFHLGPCNCLSNLSNWCR